MKKAWVALLGATLLFSGWVGAGHAASPQSQANAVAGKITGCNAKGSVTFFHWGDKNVDNADKKAIAAAEKACPGLKVTDSWDQGNYDVDLKTKIGSGNAPDLFQLDGAKRIAQYASQGALASLDSFVKRDKLNMKKTFVPNCLPQMSYKGHLYGLMLACSNQDLLFYNKDMFNARHVKFPTNKWTYKDFRAAAIKLTGNYSLPSDSTSKLRFGYVGSTDDFATQQYLFEWGANWVNKNATQCTLDSSKAAGRAAVVGQSEVQGPRRADRGAGQLAGRQGVRLPRSVLRHVVHGSVGRELHLRQQPRLDDYPGQVQVGRRRAAEGPGQQRRPHGRHGVVVYRTTSKNKNGAWWLDRFLTQGVGAQLQASYGNDTPGALALYKNKAIIKEYGPILPVAQAGQQDRPDSGTAHQLRRVPVGGGVGARPDVEGTASVGQSATKNACSAAQQFLG